MPEDPREIPFKGGVLVITDTAVKRLLQDWGSFMPGGNPPKRPLRTLAKLLTKAKPSYMSGEERAKRLIDNGFVEAEYLDNVGWRFVVTRNKDRFVLVSVGRKK